MDACYLIDANSGTKEEREQHTYQRQLRILGALCGFEPVLAQTLCIAVNALTVAQQYDPLLHHRIEEKRKRERVVALKLVVDLRNETGSRAQGSLLN